MKCCEFSGMVIEKKPGMSYIAVALGEMLMGRGLCSVCMRLDERRGDTWV